MNNEIKQFKLESVYKDAYIDRYRRLGYTLVSDTSNEENGVQYSVIVLQRDVTNPAHERLAELEDEVDELCVKAGKAAAETDSSKLRRRAALYALFSFGLVLLCVGLMLVAIGLTNGELYVAFAGWAGAFVGTVMVALSAFLRERWRMRRIDVADDEKHPGFGVDAYSGEVEKCLKEAEELVLSNKDC